MTWTKLVGASLITLTLLWGTSYGVAGYRASRAEAATPPSGQFLEIEGRRIHYVESGDGPPLVLIHGAFGSLRDFTFDLMDRPARPGI
jgi:hypothetical protein